MLLLGLVLIVLDVVALVVANVIARGGGCASEGCVIAHSGSVGRAVAALAVVTGVVVVPITVTLILRRAIWTVLVVQLLLGAVLVQHAAGLVAQAQSFQRAPTPPPTELKYRPCAEKALEGFTCVTQPPQSSN